MCVVLWVVCKVDICDFGDYIVCVIDFDLVVDMDVFVVLDLMFIGVMFGDIIFIV